MIDSGSRAGNLFRPKGIALDSENHIYITDAVFNNFQIFDTQGQLLLFVGTAGSNPGQFKSPSLIHIDSKDRIYVAEFAGQRIQVFQYLGQKYAETNPQGI
jgi:DNA-binding beta-propeller fold protein YncE